MDFFAVVERRRSIRRFKSDPVPRQRIEKVLEMAIMAPSGKNLQPWIFHILQGEQKEALINVMQQGVQELESEGIEVGSSWGSIQAMREAPVVIVVFNSAWARTEDRSGFRRYQYSVDLQSLGAAIEHMLLAARAMDLGSLWIGDAFYTEEAICRHLATDRELVAAVALGHPAEDPPRRPRRPLEDVARWWNGGAE